MNWSHKEIDDLNKEIARRESGAVYHTPWENDEQHRPSAKLAALKWRNKVKVANKKKTIDDMAEHEINKSMEGMRTRGYGGGKRGKRKSKKKKSKKRKSKKKSKRRRRR